MPDFSLMPATAQIFAASFCFLAAVVLLAIVFLPLRIRRRAHPWDGLQFGKIQHGATGIKHWKCDRVDFDPAQPGHGYTGTITMTWGDKSKPYGSQPDPAKAPPTKQDVDTVLHQVVKVGECLRSDIEKLEKKLANSFGNVQRALQVGEIHRDHRQVFRINKLAATPTDDLIAAMQKLLGPRPPGYHWELRDWSVQNDGRDPPYPRGGKIKIEVDGKTSEFRFEPWDDNVKSADDCPALF